ncbi:hypothetical protein ALQ08_200153 [Pseudomonas syringae pv. delphinii]|jgi:hypothetical protein|uniref:Uncharacterized protein n=1 Tax=Pseudomonas syringae pv. delphinii TaxID=192088 RepID=A0A3M4JVK2_9PSED|nr:hypothetical protein ALQ08_200153 [Pseudomonas syringae pv. delphinii]
MEWTIDLCALLFFAFPLTAGNVDEQFAVTAIWGATPEGFHCEKVGKPPVAPITHGLIKPGSSIPVYVPSCVLNPGSSR